MLQFYKSRENQNSKVHIPSFLDSLLDDLRFLRWDAFPQRSLPLDFSLENLVQLDMRDTQIELLWERDQHLPNLKKLDLSGSRKLIRIPDLSRCPNIKEAILSHCRELVQVYTSGFLRRLKCLWLNGCVGLMSLNIPSNILSRSSGLIVLYNCCNLEMFSVNSPNEGVLSNVCSRTRPRGDIFRYILPEDIQYCLDKQPGSIFEKFSDTFEPLACDVLKKTYYSKG
ncbi:disease resistance protein RML1B [Medicago truncatula]|uniref:disease resistance protein RML1B n=1 Tax=Medicago truncatula TaxID=3880 RepID=UPI000D2F29AD|nr:disease resistance protein RML1B [Medicago truncatula]